jgi:hypothetical protein
MGRFVASFKGGREIIYRAHITFGGVPPEICKEFEAVHPTETSCYIVPDMLSLSINPFSPATLADEDERDIVNFFSLGFSGNGYFSWRKDPCDSYWQEVRGSSTLQRTCEIAAKAFLFLRYPT